MNLKQIKDLARQVFRDQQTQDNEGGVPCSVSFIAGFVEGYLKGDKTISDTDELKDRTKEKREIADLKSQVEDLEAANHILKQALKYLSKELK